MEDEDSYDSADDSDFKPEDDEPQESEARIAGENSASFKRKRKRLDGSKTAKSGGGRRGGIMLEDEDGGDVKPPVPVTPVLSAEDLAASAAKRKKELEDLFLKELGGSKAAPKPSTSAAAAQTSNKPKSKVMEFRLPEPSKTRVSHAASSASSSSSQTTTIQRTFDFAGETVKVSQEVAADSKEARRFAEQQSAVENRSEGLGNIMKLMEKKKTMGTVVYDVDGGFSLFHLNNKQTKSGLDWQAFKQREGIEDEMEVHRKNGFLEKQDFLAEARWREHDLELQARPASKPSSSSS